MSTRFLKKRSKVYEKNMSGERLLNFDQGNHFPKILIVQLNLSK